MERAVQEIFRLGIESYTSQRKLPLHHWKAVASLMRCRTSALGGHVQRCENGHVQGIWYNSCRHRWCPQCNGLVNERWLENKRAMVLACAHRHIIFTIPHEFIALWRLNGELMPEVLFGAVRETVQVLLKDARHLGATPGMLLALHTWGRSLSFHPHVHCLVSEGGLDASGAWRTPRRRSFLPAQVVMEVFRGKFRARLKAALEAGRLRLPRGESARTVENLLNRLGRVAWNVRVQSRYGHGVGVATYLARYVRGGPLRNGQIHRVSPTAVVYRYRSHGGDSGRGKLESARTTPAGFIGRYLAHVPPLRKKTVRCCGLYSNSSRDRLAMAREQLGQAPEVSAPEPLDWQTFLERLGKAGSARCPRCGAAIEQAQALPRVHDPPRKA
jgi:Putative transposase/Transposase zinc-binding domain